jgi:hypothetical protein
MPDSIFVWTLDSVAFVVLLALFLLICVLVLADSAYKYATKRLRKLWHREPPK